MPSLRLSREEAAAITSYLVTLRQEPPAEPDPALRARLASTEAVQNGERLVRRYGCSGCHVISGMEGESRIGVELSSFGSKHLEELFFGNRTDLPVTWDDWTINKILTPRTYATERIEQLMPLFRLEKEDARALTVFLASRAEHVINETYTAHHDPTDSTLLRGRELIARYNCQGCHSFDGKDGAIRQHYEDNLEDAPPILDGEGQKLQPAWFIDFLKRPERLRPWLEVRMPSFGLSDEETVQIVDYFNALDGFELGAVVVQGPPGPDDPVQPVAALDAPPEGSFDCAACHPQGTGKVPASAYTVSRKALTAEETAAWMAEHLGIEPSQAAGDRVEAVRALLGRGAAGAGGS